MKLDLAEASGKILVAASIVSGIYGFAFFPDPHAMVITRLFFGFAFMLAPAVATYLAVVCGFIAVYAAGAALAIALLVLLVKLLTMPTFW